MLHSEQRFPSSHILFHLYKRINEWYSAICCSSSLLLRVRACPGRETLGSATCQRVLRLALSWWFVSGEGAVDRLENYKGHRGIIPLHGAKRRADASFFTEIQLRARLLRSLCDRTCIMSLSCESMVPNRMDPAKNRKMQKTCVTCCHKADTMASQRQAEYAKKRFSGIRTRSVSLMA